MLLISKVWDDEPRRFSQVSEPPMPIDPEFEPFVADPRCTVRPLPAHVPLEKARAIANAAMIDPDPPRVGTVEEHAAEGEGGAVPFRLYRPPGSGRLPVTIFCHGGGFVWGDLETHDGICRRLCIAADTVVASVAYRLAPETRFPGPVLDIHAVSRHLHERAEALGLDMDRFTLAGDSAGGNLALAATALAIGAGLAPKHLGLVYPALDPACAHPSHEEFRDGPILTSAAMAWFWASYLGEVPASTAVIHAPLLADLTGFPPVTVLTAEVDPLRDEGETLAERLREQAVPTTSRRITGTVHGFLSLAPDARASRACIEALSDGLRRALRDGLNDE